MKEHLFIASDGALYDTRAANWHSRPLRSRYSFHCREVDTVADLKATLRAGRFISVGGYPLFLMTSDGAALCFDCARKEARNIFESVASKSRDGWRVVGCDINYEDESLYCDHCNKQIESAYGNDGD